MGVPHTVADVGPFSDPSNPEDVPSYYCCYPSAYSGGAVVSYKAGGAVTVAEQGAQSAAGNVGENVGAGDPAVAEAENW